MLLQVQYYSTVVPFSPFTVVLLPASAVPKWFVTWYWNCFITHEARALRVCAPKLFAFQIGTRSTAIYVCMHTGAVFWTNFLEVYSVDLLPKSPRKDNGVHHCCSLFPESKKEWRKKKRTSSAAGYGIGRTADTRFVSLWMIDEVLRTSERITGATTTPNRIPSQGGKKYQKDGSARRFIQSDSAGSGLHSLMTLYRAFYLTFR